MSAVLDTIEPIRVCLVDDHHVVRQGLKMYMSLDPHIEVVGEASNGQEALEMVSLLQPKVVIMDIVMPVLDGIGATRILREMHPNVEILALTSGIEEHRIHAAISAGAIGYLLKDASAETLLEAIHAAAQGQVRFHPEAARRLAREFKSAPVHSSLTPKEMEILQRISKGEGNKTIASGLGITETTVKSHVSRILDKLGVSTRTQVVLYALKHKLVALSD